jgi:glycosyltransferase involved in cell wall biosynthesis
MIGPFDPTLCDGVSRSMFELLSFLKNLGHEVFILSLMHESELCRKKGLLYLTNNPDAHVVNKGDNCCNVIYYGIDVYYEILPYHRYEILHSHVKVLKTAIERLTRFTDSYLFSVDSDLTSLVAKSVLGVSGAHFFRSPPAIETYTHQPAQRELLKMRTVFAISRFTQRKLKQMLEIDSVIWYPIINLSKLTPKHRRNQHMTIGFYSAGSHKGDELVQQLIKKLPSIQFTVMGINYSYRSDASLANVRYMGDVTDLNGYYQDISLMVVPSTLEEGYSRVIVEAAKNGIPVIANNIGGIPEALGSSGILIGMESSLDRMVDKYVSAINRLFNNPADYAKYSRMAMERAREYEHEVFNQSIRIHDQYLSLEK